jgi:hypothetical protein
MTFLWAMAAIWLCLATLLPLYVLFKAVFRPDLRIRPPATLMLRS